MLRKGGNVASNKEFADFIVEQISDVGDITYKKMFGEYAIYCGRKIVALICDDSLFIKPTVAGKTYIGTVVEKPPYPGAKNCYLIEDKIDDRQWLSELIKITESELPEPKLKKQKKSNER